ncbi:zinc finger protein 79-like [Armigeres subalbatus]|uniref:zinc finger protein 79-like n=1 Tax=Armigeres subalbatus TaxID=124917 RepID=UPI002ED56B5C
MPKNYLSSRYNNFIHQNNNQWDELFCELFWSPFVQVVSGTRTRSGHVLAPVVTSSPGNSADELNSVQVEFHNDWVFMEYPTLPNQSAFAVESGNVLDTSHTDTISHPSAEESDGDQRNSYRCEKCFKRFQYPRQLVSHWKTHTEDRKHSCECGKSFKTKVYLGIHRRNTGHHDWTVRCSKCGKPFEKERHMARHSATACEKYSAKQKNVRRAV